MRRIGRRAPLWVLGLSSLGAVVAAAYVSRVASDPDLDTALALAAGLAISVALYAVVRAGLRVRAIDAVELDRAQAALASHGERLRILHEIDRAIIAGESTEAIAAAVLPPLRELLGVARVVVNMFDLAAGEVEWLAASGRRRTHIGPGVRYSIRMMGDVEALKRGEPQIVDTRALPPGPEVDALLASGVEVYMVVPMIAGGELIGALSFGGPPGPFPAEQANVAREVATQLAIAIAQTRLLTRVRRHAGELEARVLERTRELEAANQELESFAYSVSHDLRAPLRHIDGFSRMLEEDHAGRLDEDGRRLLGTVRKGAGRMGQLIDDLLAFSRFGRAAMSPDEVDMAALAQGVADELAREAPACTITVGPLPAARGDAALLRQVWINLIGNAIKYSAKRAVPRVEISGRSEAGGAVYCVTDNGAGFDPRYVDKLFKVFQRLHNEDEFSGTGVGLAIVHRIVARHGGRTWAEGRLGEGASFWFSLPA
jgi:signal transduction histidine kinase